MRKLLSLFTALLFVGSMWGAETKKIVFTVGNNDSGSTAASINTSKSDDIATLSSSYCYARTSGMWVSSGNNPGTATLTMKAAGQVKATKIVTSICGTLDKAISIEVTYMDDTKSTKTSLGTTAGDIETNLDNSKAIKSIQYTAAKASKASISQLIIHLVPSTPTIIAIPDSIGFGVKNIYNNDAAKSGSKTIKVTGSNLTADISAALDKGTIFTLPESSLDKASKDADFTVNYSVSAIGSYDDTLRLTSTGADEVKIPITLKVISELHLIDTLTRATTGVTGSSYTAFADKGANLDAEYSGVCAGGYSSIQLRNNADNSGLVSTFSDGFVRKVAIVWDSQTSNGRYVEIYGSNTAYTGSADLYDYDTDGTLLGTIKKGESTELEIEEDYKYIGFLANNTLYMDTVFITWAPATDKPAVTISNAIVGGTVAVSKLANGAAVNTGDNVAEGKKMRVTATPNGTTHMGGTVIVKKTSDNSDITGDVMSNDTLTMPAYDITISATFDPRPRVTISPKSLNFGNKVEQGDAEDEKNFTISGNDLTSGQLTISLDESIKDAYTISPASIDVNGTLAETTITVTPVTTNFGTFNGNIKVNGGGLATDTATVAVSMTIIAKNAVTITQPSNGVITVKNADNEDVASDARIVVGKRMKVTVAPNDPTTHRETLKIYKTDDEETTISVDENDSITMPDYPITIESTEVALFAVALDVKEDGAAVSHGTSATMDGGTATLYKAAGETVTLVATRATGYQFDKWTTSSTDIVIAAADSTKTSITATINGAGTITANFRAVHELLVSTTALDLGYAKLDSALDAKTFKISGASLTAGKLTLALEEDIKDAFTLSTYSINVNGSLADTTITVTPVTSVAGEFSGNLTISGGGLAAAKTVALTSEIEQTYKITWIVNGEETSLTDTAGTALVAPSAGTISGKTVIGWTDAAIATKTDTKPTIVSLSTMPAKDTTLYALYATESSKDSVLTFSYTIVPGDFSGSYSTGDKDRTAYCSLDSTKHVDITFDYARIMNQSSHIQGEKNKGKIYNTTAWGKQVKSVDIVNGGGGNNFSRGIGDSAEPTDPEGTGAFFQVYVPGSYCTASSIKITFDSTVNVTTYNAYVTRGYAVTIADGIEHGTVTIKNGTTSVESGSLVAYGTTLTVEAEPTSDQYILNLLKANTTDIKDAMSFTMGNEAVTIVAEFIDKSTVGIDDTEVGGKAVKVMRNGVLYIEKNGRTYNAMGQLIK